MTRSKRDSLLKVLILILVVVLVVLLDKALSRSLTRDEIFLVSIGLAALVTLAHEVLRRKRRASSPALPSISDDEQADHRPSESPRTRIVGERVDVILPSFARTALLAIVAGGVSMALFLILPRGAARWASLGLIFALVLEEGIRMVRFRH